MNHLLFHSVDSAADRYPDQHAMRFQGQHLTYSDLSRKSSQLAQLLRDQGICRGDRVGVFLDKSLETALAIYGIMKAGAAYVPLDPRSPVARLVDIIGDCTLKGIVAQPNKLKVLREVAANQNILQFVVGIDNDAGLDARSYSWVDVDAFPDGAVRDVRLIDQDLAYIMYTSGSTGKPKGIMHTHYSGLSYARMSAATYDVGHDDRLSNHSPLHFDMSTFDYLTGPLCGATTVIIPEAHTLFPVNLARLIQDERLTIWYSVPFALIQLLLRGTLEKHDLSSLRWILYGGEPFPVGHLRALMEHLPQARVSNVYGPAEVNQCTYYHLPPVGEWADDLTTIPLGVIWDNAEGLILGENDQPLDTDQVGELVVRTPTMMQGYWNRPDLNRQAFYRRAIYPDYVAIYYRTGDLVYRRDDGYYEFVGRKDHQVKVRGYRVELFEIDIVLTSHDAVEQGATYLIASDESDQLGAAVILREEAEVTESALVGYLKGKLPHYAVPERIRFVETLPRTGTGKIDRNALQQQAHDYYGRAADSALPTAASD